MNSYIKFSISIFLVSSFFISCKKKSDMLVKEWKATEMEFAGTKLTDEQTSVTYNFKPDGNFERVEDGKTEEGKWKLSEDESKITFDYPEENRKIVKDITELSDNKLIIVGEEHTMSRKETLVPKASSKE